MRHTICVIVALAFIGCSTAPVQSTPDKGKGGKRSKEEYCSKRDETIDPTVQELLCK